MFFFSRFFRVFYRVFFVFVSPFLMALLYFFWFKKCQFTTFFQPPKKCQFFIQYFSTKNLPPPKTCQFYIWPLYKYSKKNQLLGSPPRWFWCQKINGPKRIRRFYLCDPVRVFLALLLRCFRAVYTFFSKSVNSSYNNHSNIDLRKCAGGNNHLVGIMCAVLLMAQHQAPFLSVK